MEKTQGKRNSPQQIYEKEHAVVQNKLMRGTPITDILDRETYLQSAPPSSLQQTRSKVKTFRTFREYVCTLLAWEQCCAVYCSSIGKQ
eukprot:13415478-Ditylum_brightwellii.AAC.1